MTMTSLIGALRLVPVAVCFATIGSPTSFAWQDQISADAPPLTTESAKALKNPVPNTVKAIGRGRSLYSALGCAACHGNDGKALIEVVANATDLTDPSVWKSGTEEGLIFRSIRDGAGISMPPFKTQVPEQGDIWYLVHFIRSLWQIGRAHV